MRDFNHFAWQHEHRIEWITHFRDSMSFHFNISATKRKDERGIQCNKIAMRFVWLICLLLVLICSQLEKKLYFGKYNLDFSSLFRSVRLWISAAWAVLQLPLSNSLCLVSRRTWCARHCNRIKHFHVRGDERNGRDGERETNAKGARAARVLVSLCTIYNKKCPFN